VIRIGEGGLLGILYVKSRYSISQLFFDAKFSNPIESTINEELVYVMEERHVYVIYIKYWLVIYELKIYSICPTTSEIALLL